MSHIPDDYDQFYAELDAAEARGEAPCEICGKRCVLQGDNNYCVPCQRQVDLEEQNADTVVIPILQPITIRPVEINHELFAAAKRIVSKS
jgi:hypothetical protein